MTSPEAGSPGEINSTIAHAQVRRKRNESKSFCKTHLRKMQGNQEKRKSHGYLREPEAQAEARLIRKPAGERLCSLAGRQWDYLRVFYRLIVIMVKYRAPVTVTGPEKEE